MILALTACMVVTVTYAWLTISKSPSVNGIQVTIGGGQTILLAPDVTQTLADGTVIHYPGAFSDKLNFSQYEVYDYLGALGGLLPVSTADGIHWMAPTYYTDSDEEVKNGYAVAGQLKPVSMFEVDSTLANANLSKDEIAGAKGSYIYLDFWIVSPGSDYKIRVARGENEGGSFLIGLPTPTTSSDTISGYTLMEDGSSVGASARIGFLVNQDTVLDGSMLAYQRSPAFSEQYTHLLGVYPEKNQRSTVRGNRFTIYEPNGTLHTSASGVANGSYSITSPLKWEYGAVKTTNISSILTVQKESIWMPAEDGNGIQLERVFQSALVGKHVFGQDKARSLFYKEYLQGQVSHYVSKGDFFTNTGNLYAFAAMNGSSIVSKDTIDTALQASGATEDVFITELERNVPQRIRMYIWIEGQDVDCVADARLSSFALNIELAGSN